MQESFEFVVPLPAPMRVAPAFGFVGRERELETLVDAAAAAHEGQRRVVLVGGEAGAGKTRLAFEFARSHHAGGAIVLLGGCDAEGGPPYQPWVQILTQLVEAMPPQVARAQAGVLGTLIELLPGIEQKLPGLQPPASADAATERLRLFRAVDELLSVAATIADVVVVVDDLHWATAPSLALLRHVARSDEGRSLLVVGTFRDTSDEVTDPLASFLADLRRARAVDWLGVGALEPAAIERFVAGAARQELDPSLRQVAGLLGARSGGNAFYLCELWRHIEASGRVDVRRDVAALEVPDGVRDVVRARVAHLDPEARAIAELVAVSGTGVDARVLRAAFGGTAFVAALDELVRARLLVEIAGPPTMYRFAHDLVRDAFAERGSLAALAECHQRLAMAMERVYASDLRPVLADLARHYLAAAATGDTAPAITYARRAAAQAMRASAEEAAIVHLETARALSTPGTPDHVRLLLDLAQCHARTGLDPVGIEIYREACTSAQEQGLTHEIATAVVGWGEALSLRGQADPGLVDLLRQASARIGDTDPPLLAYLGTVEAAQLDLLGRRAEARLVAEATHAAARRLGSRLAELCVLNFDTTRGEEDDVLPSAIRGAALAEELGEVWQYCNFAGAAARGHLRQGALEQASTWLDRLRRVADGAGYVVWRYYVACHDSMLALVRGHFEEAERLAGVAAELLSDGTEFVPGMYGMQMYAARREQGRLAELAGVLRLSAASADGWWRPGLAALYAHAGMREEARRTFDALAPDGFSAVPRDSMWPACLVFLSEVCLVLRDSDHAEFLLEALEPHAGRTLGAPFTVCFGPADRLRGGLAALLGRPDVARAHFAAAFDLAERSGSPSWLARVQHDWAVALDERTDLLELARETATRLGMADLAASASTVLLARAGATPSHDKELPDGLSLRELEVLRLVAAGRSNREIGADLFLSPHTVAHHVRAILRKTRSTTRAEASTYAARQGLLA